MARGANAHISESRYGAPGWASLVCAGAAVGQSSGSFKLTAVNTISGRDATTGACTFSCYHHAQADAPSRPKGLSGATPGQHDYITKHRMSLAARCADQLTQSQTRWSIRCVPSHGIERNFRLLPMSSFIRSRRLTLMYRFFVQRSKQNRRQEG